MGHEQLVIRNSLRMSIAVIPQNSASALHTGLRHDADMAYEPKRVGRAIEAVRLRLGISTNAWAKRAGLSEGTIRAIVDGTTASTKLETLYRMADAVGVPVWELLGEDVPWKREYEDLRTTLTRIQDLEEEKARALHEALR